MHNETAAWVLERATKRAEIEYSLGDTLDIKSSVFLIVITFLATLSGQLVVLDVLPKFVKVGEVISIGLLAFSAIFAVCELRVRSYKIEPSPEKYEGWIGQLEAHYQNERQQLQEHLSIVSLQKLKSRVEVNNKINKEKSRYLHKAYSCLVVAMGIDILALIILGLHSLAH